VFRAAVLSIALTLAVGQPVALLCGASCAPHAVRASDCHHEKPVGFTRVAGDSNRCHAVLNVASFLREDERRGGAGPDVAHFVLIPRYQLHHSMPDARFDNASARQRPLERRHLSTTLRV
jgi:hypothetical protein